jgi:hypothetical protein
MLIALAIVIIAIGTISFFSHRLLCYLSHFQELDYSGKNFRDWIVENGIYDKKGSVISAIAALAIELTREKIVISLIISTLATAGLVWLRLLEDNPMKTGSLKITKQAAGIHNIALGLYSIAVTTSFIITYLLGADDDIACY